MRLNNSGILPSGAVLIAALILASDDTTDSADVASVLSVLLRETDVSDRFSGGNREKPILRFSFWGVLYAISGRPQTVAPAGPGMSPRSRFHEPDWSPMADRPQLGAAWLRPRHLARSELPR